MSPNETLVVYTLPASQRLHVVRGDLTLEAVDAIVNAANSRLAHGGGVAGAIVRRGGAAIQEESRAWAREHGPVATGDAAITGAGALAAKYVIHAVGPVWRDHGDEPELLARAVQSALALADDYGLASVSMPAISSGIFGFPKPLAVRTIVDAVEGYFADFPESSITDVHFCSIDAETARLFAAEVRRRVTDHTDRRE